VPARPRVPRARGNSNFRHLRAAYRSGLEAALSAAIVAAGLPVCYEQVALPFTQPAKDRKYRPDFILPNGIVIESKGLFSLEDRQKMCWVRDQHPELDIRMVFSNAKAKLTKGSPTTYADWCDKQGFRWSHKAIPEVWMRETPNRASLAALKRLGYKTA
jgi:hypothetical protein